MATELGPSDQRARANAGLGHAHRSLGDMARAGDHYRDAVALYTRLGMRGRRDSRLHRRDVALGDRLKEGQFGDPGLRRP